jgi:hypothetical protein
MEENTKVSNKQMCKFYHSCILIKTSVWITDLVWYNWKPKGFRVQGLTLNTMENVSKIAWNSIGWFMVFNATFNNISVISWRSGRLVEETVTCNK